MGEEVRRKPFTDYIRLVLYELDNNLTEDQTMAVIESQNRLVKMLSHDAKVAVFRAQQFIDSEDDR